MGLLFSAKLFAPEKPIESSNSFIEQELDDEEEADFFIQKAERIYNQKKFEALFLLTSLLNMFDLEEKSRVSDGKTVTSFYVCSEDIQEVYFVLNFAPAGFNCTNLLEDNYSLYPIEIYFNAEQFTKEALEEKGLKFDDEKIEIKINQTAIRSEILDEKEECLEGESDIKTLSFWKIKNIEEVLGNTN